MHLYPVIYNERNERIATIKFLFLANLTHVNFQIRLPTMLALLSNNLKRLIDLGAAFDKSYFDTSLRVIFNRILLVIIGATIIATIGEIFNGNPRGIFFAFVFILLECALLWLSSIGKFRIAAILLCTVFPAAITLLSLAFSDLNHLAFYISVFALITFLYIQSAWLRNLLIIFQVLCYVYSIYFQIHYEPEFGLAFSQVSNCALFFLFGVVFFTASQILVTKLRENEILFEANIKSLNEKKDQLQTANNQLARFSAIASHDMKTPLRTIHSFIGLIEMRIKKNNLAGIEELIQQVKHGAEQMNSIIDEALNYDPLSVVGGDLEPINLNEMAESHYLSLKNNYGDFEFVVLNHKPFYSHKAIINKLILNLMENGLKYNDKEVKKIWMNQEIVNDQLVIGVADNGIGIKPSKHELVFEIYERLDNDMNVEGSGLGLAICKGILAKIDGEIWVDKNYKDGAKFMFSIPKDQYKFIH